MQSKKKIWTKEEREFLREQFPFQYTQVIADSLQRSYRSVCSQAALMGLKKDAVFLKTELQKQAQRLVLTGKVHRYQKGSVPANKGKKVSDELYKKMQATMFKKGQTPHNAKKNWEEVLRKDTHGKEYYMIKLPGERRLKYKHIWVWESVNGKVPKGFNIIFKDGNQLNCTIENLACISNAELMHRNTIQRYPKPLQTAMKIISKLNKKINYAEKQD